ncbi:hypothetical protein TetV_154 [Tetraselmis virus 1]|uniref:Uncharacterized protein n=1 Tax=Tetraselmis virus 1 TaxID=2060617 RepID=A0A2P0VMW8_9VIRU|nr:hypothetical protein QJ968_gp154 [Tetraselmis virus 1]AUF82246.1 hypothetical protein TetV_154 [Tetraselmis virus 1]
MSNYFRTLVLQEKLVSEDYTNLANSLYRYRDLIDHHKNNLSYNPDHEYSSKRIHELQGVVRAIETYIQEASDTNHLVRQRRAKIREEIASS